MRVRPAGPGDEAALEALLLEVYEAFGEDAPPRADLRALVTHAACGDSGLAFLVAEDGGPDLLGLVSLAPVPTTLQAGEFVYLDDLYVREGSRGKGIGTELLAAARRWSVERGAVEIRLAADASDERLWKLYRDGGYARQRMSWMVLDLGSDWSGRPR
jgi:GNAT superfamily N-acetyltransferase